MAAPVLGIDLGTTNSVVAVSDAGNTRVLTEPESGSALIPSVVSFHPSGDVLVGHGARDRRLVDAANTVYSIKRLIGRPFRSEEVRRARERFPFELREGPTGGALVVARGESYTLPEISAFVLREVRSVAERALGQAAVRAVITVPANFNELQRSATKAAGRVAGLEVMRILNEPTAAALAYGYGSGQTGRVAIYDLGGGTFDITLLEMQGDVFEVTATAGDTFLGGDDIDLLVAERMADVFLRDNRYDPRGDRQAYERLRAAAEWAKCELSAQPEVELTVEELAYGEDGAALNLNFTMTRREIEAMLTPLVGRTFDVCEDAMRLARLRPAEFDRVILVGGSTRIPLVRRMVQEYFKSEPCCDIDPDTVVAMGAAIHARALAGDVPQPSAPSSQVQVPDNAIGKVALRKVSAERVSLPAGLPPPIAEASNRTAGGPPPAADVVLGSSIVVGAADIDVDVNMNEMLPPAPPPPGGTGGFDAAIMMQQPQAPYPSAMALPQTRADRPAPLLLDVTPQSLVVETVSGYCDPVIRRNAAIPVEQTRVFSTGLDGQESVLIRIAQGESRRYDECQALGQLELHGLRPAPRGAVKIAVTFEIDADGTLQVRAEDPETGQRQGARIALVGGISDEEIAMMAQRQGQHFAESR
ncbi:MAG: Hsp70 family protein [Deltaproteobacteria bacterium]|nr:Hsp70 family protein [Deltaproteobacteria bacterium]